MTPSGHAGASIVAAYVIERCAFNNEAIPVTLGLAALVGLLPDLDGLAALALNRYRPSRNKLRHHEFLTHTPLFYLILTVALWIAGASREGVVLFGILTFGHLVLDSWGTDDGIMWLWPLSRRQFSLFPRNLHAGGAHGLRFYRRHVRCARVFVPEVALLASGSLLAIYALSWRLA
jgi:hypothetical protein